MVRRIIPPSIEDHIEQNAGGAEKARARKNRILSERVRGMRIAGAKRAYEPGQGEKREVRDADGTTNDDGPVVRLEDSPDTTDKFIDDPYDYAGVAYDYLFRIHGRHGPDGAAGRQLSIVHYSEGGGGWDNAAYYRDPQLGMVIVVGDGDVFPPFHLSPGIFAHEWGHALTEATCNLGYGNDEAGGNNEAGSDIFAALVEQWRMGQTAGDASWLIGEELFSAGLQGRALRDMLRRGPAYDDPLIGQDPQINDASGYRRGQDPHVTSAVTNRWFAEACMQLPTRYSWETIGPVWFEAWTRLQPTSGFTDVAAATVTLARARYGENSAELAAVRYGWDAAKVAVPATLPDPVPTPPAPTEDSPCQFTDAEVSSLVRSLRRVVVAHPVGRRWLATLRRLPSP